MSLSPKTGQLTHVVTVQQPSTSQNSFGEESVSWANFATVMASIEPAGGTEQISAQQVTGSVSHKIVLHHIAGIIPKWRIVYGARVFEILSVINVEEDNRMLELSCVEKV